MKLHLLLTLSMCLDARAAYRRRLHAAVAAPFWQSKYTSFPLLVN